MAWCESSPDSTRRNLCTTLNSSGDSSSSSLRVPAGFTPPAGNTRRSEILRSSLSSALPVPLNSSKITVSPVDPVSTIAVAMMVSDPPSSMLRAAGEDAARGGRRVVVGAAESGDRVQQHDNVFVLLHQSLGTFDRQLGDR